MIEETRRGRKTYNGADQFDTLIIQVKGRKISLSFSNYLQISNQDYRNPRKMAQVLTRIEHPRFYYSSVIDFPERFNGNEYYIEINALFTLNKATGKIPDGIENLKPVMIKDLRKEIGGKIVLLRSGLIRLESNFYNEVIVYKDSCEFKKGSLSFRELE